MVRYFRNPAKRWYRRLLRLQFLIFHRHRHNRLITEEVAGKSIIVLPEVFNPKLFGTGEFLAETLKAEMFDGAERVLDLGTGTGIGALLAAEWCASVTAVDVNPAAVKCARINSLLHGMESKIEVREGDLFDPVVDESFDRILFNPPYFLGEPHTPFDQALYSEDIALKFSEALKTHLTREGLVFLVLSDRGAQDKFLSSLLGHGFQNRVVAEKKLFGERLRIYEIQHTVTLGPRHGDSL